MDLNELLDALEAAGCSHINIFADCKDRYFTCAPDLVFSEEPSQTAMDLIQLQIGDWKNQDFWKETIQTLIKIHHDPDFSMDYFTFDLNAQINIKDREIDMDLDVLEYRYYNISSKL